MKNLSSSIVQQYIIPIEVGLYQPEEIKEMAAGNTPDLLTVIVNVRGRNSIDIGKVHPKD